MQKSILLLSAFTAISCQTVEPMMENTESVVVETNNLSGVITSDYKNDAVVFRQKMDKTIEANSQSLAEIRARIKRKNKEFNLDFTTTIFELEMANGYMRIKLEDYKPQEADKWKIFKELFSLQNSRRVCYTGNKQLKFSELPHFMTK